MTNEDRDDAPEPAEIVEQATATGAMDEQIAELQERLLRSQAELENFRKRSLRDIEQARKYLREDGRRGDTAVGLQDGGPADRETPRQPWLPDDRD